MRHGWAFKLGRYFGDGMWGINSSFIHFPAISMMADYALFSCTSLQKNKIKSCIFFNGNKQRFVFSWVLLISL